ncbi:MAG: heat-inducible transcription repressor HrcA [Erysipelotrichaceae bacterium]|nr:heat-inducible transcription repressor HrcA [Erysipelotrichaceae bacterium]MBQ1300839.1 heat-inducible transcription repressor HrcA [Erysipelotrichaceae bacterium]MBQ1304375.1 heat-inducible transcription repressor HrcA [Erysipelotrichaceae bacterium]MBQ2214401.1 heat-inducible transcription repressor HrcA [Erysipelotrichaceae bacterium]MBQ2685109.1 heat-inducible transcription repressor HrcA [Erysipelotrichaceae bacterium]
MLTSRQEVILKVIVEEFIKTAEPVGSKLLVEKYGINYSSATIRNEMNYLETEGLLEKTHTSSGRVPSTLGYRYYVEHLMDHDNSVDEKYELQTVLADNNVPLEDVIQRSCDILSSMTNLTSVVLGPDANKQTLAHIQLFPLDSKSCVAVFITDQGHTENKTFKFEDQITVEDIQNCTNILNDRLTGTPINEIVEKMNEIKPILAYSVKKHEALFNAFMQAFIKFASDNVYYSGASNMLYQPEFADIEKMRSIMKMLEDSKLWRSIGNNDDRLRLETSSDNQLVWFDDMAVVSSKFRIGDEEGKLMVVGPSRMDYNKVTKMLEFASAFIENQYNKRIK